MNELNSRSNTRVRIDILDCSIYIFWIILCEYIQCRYDQAFSQSFVDSFFLIMLYVVLKHNNFHFISHAIIIFFTAFETSCWIATRRGICSQVFWALIDFRYIWIAHRSFLYYGAFLLAAGIGLSRIYFPSASVFIPVHPVLAAILLIVLFAPFARNIHYSLVPYEVNYTAQASTDRLIKYLSTKRVNVTIPKTRRNLILIHLECTEQQSLGLFNPAHRDLMPFMSSLANKTTVLNEHYLDQGQGYTMASVFVQQSGIPMLGISTHNRGSVFFSSLAHLVSDYLSAAGYNCYASCTPYCSQGILYEKHHMKPIDDVIHHTRSDWPHFNYINKKLLPKLKEEQPFYLIIHTENTHPLFTIDPECLREKPYVKDWPRSMAAVECSDILIEDHLKAIKDLGLDETTEVVFYGDHLLWTEPVWYENGLVRKLLMVFPNQKHGFINKRTSWYDVPPTLLEILGITEYEPKFPFGENMFGPLNGTMPTDGDKSYIQNQVHMNG